MQLPDFLTEWPHGEIVLTDHRIGLYHLVHFYNEGYSPEMLAEQFPTLSLALIHKTLGYYLENRADVDAYIARTRTALAQQRSRGQHADAQALRERFESLQNARVQQQ